MLTPPAFNALLKTLEEPPPHVKFIFATTEVQKIPITILSRCQRFDFAGISTARIVERLREVVAGEGMQADEDALELVARRAGGSMRDAQSLLDQLLAFGGERLTADQIHRLLGTANDDHVLALASAVLGQEPGKALSLLRQSIEEGLQLGELLDQLLAYWRDLMIVRCAGPDYPDLNTPARHRDMLKQQAAALELDTILAGLDVLSTTKARLRGISHGSVLVEMALVRLGRLGDLVSISQLAQMLSQPRDVAPSAATPPRANARPPESVSASSPRPSAPALPRAAETDSLKKKPLIDADSVAAPSPLTLSPDTLSAIWQAVLGQVGPMMASDLEKAGLPAISGPNTLVLRFPIGYNAQREHCNQPARVVRVEEALRKITGQACSLRIESAGTEAVPKPGEAESVPSPYQRTRAEAMKEPLVKRAMEALGAQILDVEEGFGAAPSAPAEQGARGDSEEV
jgi:DNA polymerase-3 subunit gamma/tau